MKRVKALIKLSKLNSDRLNEKELSHVTGGLCWCGCFYANCGGSSKSDNDVANSGGNKTSIIPHIGDQWS